MKNVLVIGDIIEDVYETYAFRKMCPDVVNRSALVLRSKETRVGGAANVAVNLHALSPSTRITLIGELDANMARSIKRMTRNGVDMSYCEVVEVMDISKRRIFNGSDMLVRLDRSDTVGIYTQEMITNHLKSYLANNDPDLIILSDYGHHTVCEEALQQLLRMRSVLMVDTKETNLTRFEGSLLCKLNELEWRSVIEREHAPERFFKYLVVTNGANGSTLKLRRQFDQKVSRTDEMHVRAFPVETVDVCGCGDTFLAGLAASMLDNGDPYTALLFATAAAATVVTQKGTAVADREKTLRLLGMETESEAR